MITALSTIFVLGVLIFFHELGHFIMAKRAGIRVDKFSLGFPPAIFNKQIGETTYSIGLIPLGGFVKMAGENPDEEATGAEYEFMSKSIAARAAVIFAGPFMNFILAWFILWGLYVAQGEPVIDQNRTVIGIVAEDSPASEAGLQPGDVVTAINGQAIGGFAELTEKIRGQVEKPVELTWMRGENEMTATVTTRAEEMYNEKGDKVPIGVIGVGQQSEYNRLGIFAAAGKGFTRTLEFIKMIGSFVWDLVSFKVSAKMIGGPVFIAQMAGQTAQLGFAALLVFMAFLSVNLAVLNVLPIPVLDGGHLVFLLIEKIKGSPLTVNQRMIAQQVGLVFLLLVIVMVTYNDIMRFISG